jgi:CheY-like chemotaxis protein
VFNRKKTSLYKDIVMLVLLVDDCDITLKGLQFLLQKFACKSEVATTSAEAFSLYSKKNYDLIFMDVGLPDISGIETTRQIRKYSAREKFVPIIALTCYCDEEYKKACFTAGMNDFLTKPLRYVQLQKILLKYTSPAPCLFTGPWYKPGAVCETHINFNLDAQNHNP